MENTDDITATIMVFSLYDDFVKYMSSKRIYVSRSLIRSLGKDAWNELLKEFVGYFTVSKVKGLAIDCLYDEMECLFPHLFTQETTNQEDQLLETFECLRKARNYKKEIRAYANSINY